MRPSPIRPALRPIRVPLLALLMCLLAWPAAAQRSPDGLPDAEAAPAGDADPPRLVLIERELLTRDLAVALDLDLVAVREGGHVLEAVVRDAELDLMDAIGLPYTIEIHDMPAFYRSRLERGAGGTAEMGVGITPAFGSGGMGGYYTYAEILSILDQLRAMYPTLISARTSIGTTLEGRDMWMVRISDNPDTDENEPEVRFDCNHHAREMMSVHSTLWFMFWILENYGTDPLATYLVDEREIYLVPVVNVDGWLWNETTDPSGGGMWRKNRRNNGDGTFGVDLNRNYTYQWGYDTLGSSTSTSSETYRGASAGSEPEVQVMMAWFAQREFVTALSIHSYSNLWIWPWGYDEILPPNNDDYIEIGELAAEVNGYLTGPGAATLYPANGTTIDYDQFEHDTMAWLPEIGSSSQGFWPATADMVPLASVNLPGLQRTAWAAGAYVHVDDLQRTDAGDGDGSFEAGEDVDFVLDLRNSGLAASGTAVTATLATSSPDASISDGSHDFGAMASFSSADNGAAPLTLALSGSASSGSQVDYVLTVSYETHTETIPGTLIVGTRRPFVLDELESDVGWTAGVPGDTATTGLWVRGAPIGTTSSGQQANPGTDATPDPGTQAFITGNGGGSGGNDDVDDGKTTLLSPIFDLSGTGTAVLSYARWYADLSVADDSFEIDLSNDGGQNWTSVESVTGVQNSWTTVEVFVEDVLPQTDEMQLRFTAEDDPNNSLVEAGVDDVTVSIYDELPRINVYGTAAIGTPVAFNAAGEQGDQVTWFFSPLTGFLNIPSIQGPLLLDLSTMIGLFSVGVPASGLSTTEIVIPNNPGLIGTTAYFQAFVLRGGAKHFSNRDDLTVE
jgi:hypothetical protein